MKLLLKKHLNSLHPTDAEGQEWLGKQKAGQEFMVEVKRARSGRQHRLFFALLRTVYHNQEYFKSQDDLLDAIKIAVGHTKTIVLKSGVYKIPKSIAFHNMPQDEFNDFFNRVVDFVCTHVMPGTDPALLIGEVGVAA